MSVIKTIGIGAFLLLTLTAAQYNVPFSPRAVAGGGITFQSSSSAHGAAIDGAVVGVPATLSDNDVMVSVMMVAKAPTTGGDWTCDTGWTEISGAQTNCQTGADILVSGCYKVVTDAASEPATHEHTHDLATAGSTTATITSAYSGVDNTTPISISPDVDCLTNVGLTPGPSTLTAPSITTSEDGEMVISWSTLRGTGTSDITDDPSPATTREETVGGSRNTALGDFEKATAGATSTVDWSYIGDNSNEEGVTMTFSLDPN